MMPSTERSPIAAAWRSLFGGLVTRPRPWKTWQAASSVAVWLLAVWVFVDLVVWRRQHRVAQWCWAALIWCAALALLAGWIGLYRARKQQRRE